MSGEGKSLTIERLRHGLLILLLKSTFETEMVF